jgi:putative mRNA 3-end processing factor
MPPADLLVTTDRGLFCEAGGFYVDPWRAVDRAVVTHAHGDHIARGCGVCLCSSEGREVLRQRLGPDARIETLDYGESVAPGGVRVSLHPAGHIRGSAQVRIEHRGEVWCVSGDYKLASDPTCTGFDTVRCHTFITESTFGLPIYRWQPASVICEEVNQWWRANQLAGRTSVLFAYSLGKAQRLIAGVDPSIGPIFCHGAVESVNRTYRDSGVALPATALVSTELKRADWSDALIVAPPSARGTTWMRRFGDVSTGFASGWMTVRGARRRRSVDRGFTLSDHADWPDLHQAIRDTGATRVLVTHGSTGVMVRWLKEQGLEASSLRTRYEGELGEDAGDEDSTDTAAATPRTNGEAAPGEASDGRVLSLFSDATGAAEA